MLIHVTNKILKSNLVIINEVSRIPGEEENGPKDWVGCLVPPMFAQDVRGIGLAREVHHQDIL
jgi:hypothetical protein